MLKTCRSWLNVALLLALTGSLLYIRYHRCKDHPTGVIAPVATGGPLAVPIRDTYIDSSGAHHVVIDAGTDAQIKREAARVAAPIAAKIDSLALALAVKPRQIEGYAAVAMAASSDSVRVMRRVIDSLKRQTFYYKDKYLSLVFRAGSPTDSLTASNFDFAYDVDLRAVDYNKRDRLLGLRIGRKRYYTDISSSDPRVRIKGVEKFTIQRRAPAFGLRVQALASYNLFTRNYAAGLGLRLDAGDRFNAGFNYTYNFGLSTFTPIIYTKYDLLQFGR